MVENKTFSKLRIFSDLSRVRACLPEGGGPQIGEVTHSGGVKNNPPLYAILQPQC